MAFQCRSRFVRDSLDLGALCLLVVLATALIGCGKGGEVATYPVAGTVRYSDGSPLRGGTITFHSPDNKFPTRGVIDDDGSFTIGTFAVDDGAPAGSYQVSIIPDLPAGFDPDSGKQPQRPIAQKYYRPETSGITIEVSGADSTPREIVVQRPAK